MKENIHRSNIFIGKGAVAISDLITTENGLKQTIKAVTGEKLLVRMEGGYFDPTNYWGYYYLDVLSGKKYPHIIETKEFEEDFPKFKDVEYFFRRDVKKLAALYSIKDKEVEKI